MDKTKFQLPDALKESPDADALGKVGQAVTEAVEGSLDKRINEAMDEIRKNGASAEAMNKLDKAIEMQGTAIAKLKEQGLMGGKIENTMRKKFFDKFDEFKSALFKNGAGVTIKAIDEHNPDLIETTVNGITTADGSFLPENTQDAGTYFKRRGRAFIRDIANVAVVGEVPEVVTYVDEGTEQGTFAIVAENGLKPQQFVTLVKSTVHKKKVAGYMVATEELMRDRRRAWAAIQRLFNNKLERNYETVLATELAEITTDYVSSALDGQVTNPGNTHAIIAAMAQLESLDFTPDTLVINPADKWAMALDTTPDGSNYIFLPVVLGGGEMRPVGLNVITSTLQPAGTFLLGESGTWEIEESGVELRAGYVNDDLIHNRQTMVLERQFVDWIPKSLAGSWMNGNFADIKEAITKA